MTHEEQMQELDKQMQEIDNRWDLRYKKLKENLDKDLHEYIDLFGHTNILLIQIIRMLKK